MNRIVLMNKCLKKKCAIGFVALAMGLASCSAPKDVAYMQDFRNSSQFEITNIENKIKVRPEDKLSIIVKSKDAELSELFNLSTVSHRVGLGVNSNLYSNNNILNYTVNSSGDIDFPVLGEIHIAGMTREEVAKYIKDRLIKDKLVNDPVVTVEFMNAGITLAGEVTKPGRYDINKDHLTILEAIGMAGDLTIQGKRENILVIRQENGKPKAYFVDLTKASDVLNSPVYYLQQDDYIYVEPNNMRKRQSTVNGNNVLSASFWVSIASLMTSIAVLIFK